MTDNRTGGGAGSPTLVEELALLALREDTGRPLVGWLHLQYGFAGAILAELAIAGRITLEDERLVLTSTVPLGDLESDRALAMFAEESKPRRPGWWVGKLGKNKLRKDVLDGLVERGLVHDESAKVLGIFPVVRLPEAQPLVELQVRDRIQLALDGGSISDRTAALIGLASGTGLLKKLFPEADKKRVKAILSDQWAGNAVQAVLMSITVGVTTSIVVTSATST